MEEVKLRFRVRPAELDAEVSTVLQHPSGWMVVVDFTPSEETKGLEIARIFISNVQQLRKKCRLCLEDKIEVLFKTESEVIRTGLKDYAAIIHETLQIPWRERKEEEEQLNSPTDRDKTLIQFQHLSLTPKLQVSEIAQEKVCIDQEVLFLFFVRLEKQIAEGRGRSCTAQHIPKKKYGESTFSPLSAFVLLLFGLSLFFLFALIEEFFFTVPRENTSNIMEQRQGRNITSRKHN